MPAQAVTLQIKQGEDDDFVVTCYSTAPDPLANPPVVGVVQDLTGWTNPQMQLRLVDNLAGPLVFTMTPTIMSPPTNGQIAFTFPAAQSVNWTFQNCSSDLFAYNPAGERKCLLDITVAMDPSCTAIP